MTAKGEVDVKAFARRMEEDTYITYREWPIFLVRRLLQLEKLVDTTVPKPAAGTESLIDPTKTKERK